MKRILLTLLTLVLAVAAFAGDTLGGGEGGAINLPGGRNGSSMQSNGGGSTSEWTVSGKSHLRLRLSPEMANAIVVLRAVESPFLLTLAPVDGVITVTHETLTTLRRAEEPGFVLDIVTASGSHLHVSVTFRGADELYVTAR